MEYRWIAAAAAAIFFVPAFATKNTIGRRAYVKRLSGRRDH
jgi:hypothetical protein